MTQIFFAKDPQLCLTRKNSHFFHPVVDALNLQNLVNKERKYSMISRKVLLTALQATALLPLLAKGQTGEEATPVNKRVCLMMYSMAGRFSEEFECGCMIRVAASKSSPSRFLSADNDLEMFLREDIVELIRSPAITEESLNTWIYFDQRNLADLPYYSGGMPINESLPLLYEADGSELPAEKFEGSRILHYDHSLSKMTVNATYANEVDSDSPVIVEDFMTWALRDCVATGAEEYFMIFTSHGGGFIGYGGDENDGLEVAVNAEEADGGVPSENPDLDLGERRKLVQSNQRIVDAIESSLTKVEGAPAILDVIGFDACLMSGLGAIDEYRDVAKYVLASEATEPGHGEIPLFHAKG
jgi:hypothetical protein